tara:strand:+ start:30 stop:638 length:609 start_codon:yes stop_codon:yes gene_type:complete
MSLESLQNVPRGQLYCCLSFLSNKDNNTVTTSGVRVGGVFETYDGACAHAKLIQQEDDRHHVFVGEVGKWLPYDPDPSSQQVEDSEYANEQLNTLMKGHKENMERARVFHELRKNESMMDNINENMESKNKLREEVTTKLSNVKNMEEAKTLTTSLENLEEQIKGMQSKLESCKTNEQSLQEELGNLGPGTAPQQNAGNVDV